MTAAVALFPAIHENRRGEKTLPEIAPMKKLRGNLIAVAAGVILILLVELLLAFTGVAPLGDRDPFVGFEGSTPLFVPDSTQPGRYTLNPAKEPYFNKQQFTHPKPAGTFRIVSFGGSTTYGRPYINDTSFPAWIASVLNRAGSPYRFENINLGGISYAGYRVRRLAGEMSRYSPDLYVVYSGHNEFLESRTFEKILQEPGWKRTIRKTVHRSRIYTLVNNAVSSASRSGITTLPDDVEAKLEEIGGYELYKRDEPFRKGVILQYRHSLEKIIELCREKKIPLILCTLPSNLTGISPFKSEHRNGITLEESSRFSDLVRSMEELLVRGRFEPALDLASRAEEIDDSYAHVHYLKGIALRALGRLEEAEESFVKAREEDIVPLRALGEFNDIIRELAEEYGVPLADVEAAFKAAAPGGIPGNELFIDHVHPTVRGQQLIAWVVLETAAKSGVIPFDPFENEKSREEVMGFLKDESDRIAPRYIALGYWGVGRLFHWAGKFPEAREALLTAWRTVKDIAEIPYLLGDIEVSMNNPEQALLFFGEAQKIGGEESRIAYGMTKAALQLNDGKMALKILEGITEEQREGPLHLGFTGEAFLLTGRIKEAVTNLEAAVSSTPDIQRFHFSLARAYILDGNEVFARKTFTRYAQLAGLDPLLYNEFRKLTFEAFEKVFRGEEGK